MSEWMPWDGGKCPEEIRWAKLHARLADGRLLKRLGHNLDWDHQGDGTDIIAYRIVEDQQ